jgi:H/ACA ribonucleoprotein complex subunit 2
MAKDKSEKVKKEKKEKRSETDGVKKSKKDKIFKPNGDNVAAALEETLAQSEAPVAETKSIIVKESNGGELAVKPVGALVPFANPLADDKVAKKVLKSVKKGTAAQSAPEMEESGGNIC